MKKRNVKTLRLAKKSISNLAFKQLGGLKNGDSDIGGGICGVRASYETGCPECPTGEVLCEAER